MKKSRAYHHLPALLGSILLTFLLSSCYCFKTSYSGSPIDLAVTSSQSREKPCCDKLNSKSITFSPYYGFLHPEKRNEGDLTDTRNSFGQIGVQANYLYAPIKRIPFKIASVGLDFSYINFDNYFTGNSFTACQFDRQIYRIMVNHNFATLIRPNIIGYVNTQVGFNIYKDHYAFPNSNSNSTTTFDFRIGYNLNYFLTNNIVLIGEAGYGGGSYLKTGLAFWF